MGMDREQLVEACTAGVHSKHVQLGSFDRFGLDDEQLEALSAHFESVAKGETEDLGRLIDSPVRPPDDAPARVIAAILGEHAPEADAVQINAVANLWQLAIEEARDGNVLQDLFKLYQDNDLAICPANLGISWAQDDLLKLGKDFQARNVSGPWEATAHLFALNGMKIKHWGERYSGIADAGTLAREMEAGDFAEYLPRVKAMAPARICILGHSFASPLHWSAAATFPNIVMATFANHNPGVEFTHVNEGGMETSRALRKYLDQVVEMDPDLTLVVLAYKSDDDYPALQTICSRLDGRVMVPDGLACDFHNLKSLRADAGKIGLATQAAGAGVLKVVDMLDSHPDRESFIALDDIHMGETYHKPMAVALLKDLLHWAESR